jgi:indole-3-glycerol phosphate synthase
MKLYGLDKLFIAEVKTVSPFGFKSNFDEDKLLDLAIEHGNMISIHVDALWQGNTGSIAYASTHQRYYNSSKPILAKGLHLTDSDIDNSLEFKADYVLVVGRIPAKKYLKQCYMEPLNTEQLMTGAYMQAVNQSAGLVLNNRDLLTGDLRGQFFPNRQDWVTYWTHESHTALTDFKKNLKVPIIQASGISKIIEVHPEVDGFIVGEHLPAFILQKLMMGK